MTFHDLHHRDTPLLLPNAWDAASALALAEAGFTAVGTTSLGVAAAAGQRDAAGATRAPTVRLATALRGLPVPLSVDIESGFSSDPGEVVELAAELAALGVAGINLEDSPGGHLVAVAQQARLVRSVKDRVPALFLNARTDTHWLDPNASVADAVTRVRAYADAGADGVFVPGLTDPGDIVRVVAAVDLPVNLLLSPAIGSVADLGSLGVRRVSTGSYLFRAVLAALTAVAEAARSGGPLPTEVTSYAEIERRTASLRNRTGGGRLDRQLPRRPPGPPT